MQKKRYNAEIGEDGFIRILEDCEDEELFTKYLKKDFDWDLLEKMALNWLVDEIELTFPGLTGTVTRMWTTLRERKTHLNRWISKLIEGKTTSVELHWVKTRVGGESTNANLISFLTYGPNSVKYNLRHWGQERKEWKPVEKGRKLTSNYAEKWEGGATIIGKPNMLMDINKGNPNISTLIRKTELEEKKQKTLSKIPGIEVSIGRIKIKIHMRAKKESAR